jgi:hypothetical protein
MPQLLRAMLALGSGAAGADDIKDIKDGASDVIKDGASDVIKDGASDIKDGASEMRRAITVCLAVDHSGSGDDDIGDDDSGDDDSGNTGGGMEGGFVDDDSVGDLIGCEGLVELLDPGREMVLRKVPRGRYSLVAGAVGEGGGGGGAPGEEQDDKQAGRTRSTRTRTPLRVRCG